MLNMISPFTIFFCIISGKKSSISIFFIAFLLVNQALAQSWVSNSPNSWTLNATSSASTATGNNLGSFSLIVTNPASSIDAITASVSSSDGTQASGSGSGTVSLINVLGYGGGTGTAGSGGPGINFTSSIGGNASITNSQYVAGTMQNAIVERNIQASYTKGPGSVISVISNGSSSNSAALSGGNSNAATFSGGVGGNINVAVTGGTLNLGGSTSSGTDILWQPSASVISAISAGGTAAAIQPYNLLNPSDATVGSGGGGGSVSLTNNANIVIGSSSSPMTGQVAGITAVSSGAPGAVCCTQVAGESNGVQLTPNYNSNTTLDLWTGVNGNGGQVNVSNSGSMSSWGSGTTGIIAASIGGAPQVNRSQSVYNGGQWFNLAQASGLGGDVGVSNSGDLNLLGQHSFGIVAVSTGQPVSLPPLEPISGTNVSSGNVNIQNTGKITIGTPGAASNLVSSGLLALSSPGWMTAPQNNIRNGSTTAGGGGNVQVTNSGAISAYGASSYGIAALTIGNSGIFSNSSATSNLYYMGNGASSNSVNANGGTASITNSGAITVAGQGASGLVAMSNGDGGLVANLANPVYSSTVTTNPTTQIQTAPLVGGTIIGNHTGSYTANGGTTTISNTGSIFTGILGGGGEASIGILAQSIGGGGGVASGSSLSAGIGDTGGFGGVGGAVNVSNTGSLVTLNDGSYGILAQSIGGGGGNGASGFGGFVAVGGSGGNGGSGGTINITNGIAGETNYSSIVTYGDFSSGIVAHTIGGGGGNGGYAKTAGIFASVGIGGSGGNGGSGGSINFSNYQNIITSGDQSHNLILQSIGGGGGTGGAANSYTVGLAFGAAISLGGSGAYGGSGGALGSSSNPILNTGVLTTSGKDSMGLLLQSIGGGGGNAGSAFAKTLASSLPLYPEIPTFAFTSSIGGTGGAGGSGGNIYSNNFGSISTFGSNAHGFLGQSIGGGGGNGGDSTAGANLYGNSTYTLNSSVSLGGSGGVAGSGGQININNSGSIRTYGNNGISLFAQSIGGGGGTGGTANATETKATTGEKSLNLALSLGGSGGAGGSGGEINLTNNSLVQTLGSSSIGVMAQSIGGGGGVGATAGTQGISNGLTSSVALGASGGAGGDSGAVTVNNYGNISTGGFLSNQSKNQLALGGDSHAIVAQSIAGGGGIGGSSDPAANLISNPFAATTQGLQAYATYNGIYEFFESPSISTFPKDFESTVGVGGNGGVAGTAGAVTINNSGVVSTVGHRAFGVLAQSIGGGGGYGASVMSGSSAVGSSASGGLGLGAFAGLTFNSAVNVGGVGGSSSNGGAVNLNMSATSAITTSGYGSHAILAQSIGGGGGYGADGSIVANSGFTGSATWNDGLSGGLKFALGNVGTTPSVGSGGTVTYSSINGRDQNTGAIINPTITTYGDHSIGLLAQSIGGGGGVASGGCTNNGLTSGASACLANTLSTSNSSTPANFINQGQMMTYVINPFANTGNSLNLGGAVTINSWDTINIFGSGSIGVAAQSIGGGGGLILGNSINIASATLPAVGSTIGAGGSVNVTVNNINLASSATGSIGVLAQSIGGGGGFIGDPQMPLAASLPSYSGALSSGVANSNGGGVAVGTMPYSQITMNGANQIGIVAQSIGGGGGIASVNGNVVTQNTSTQGAQVGAGGGMFIALNGSIIDAGNKGGTIGVFAQSQGNSQLSNAGNIQVILSTTTQMDGCCATSAVIKADTGIVISGGSDGTSAPNLVQLNDGTSIEVPYGNNAILSTYGTTNVNNYGTISGGIVVGPTAGFSALGGTITNYGTINATSTITTSNNSFKNFGKLFVAGFRRVGQADIYGSFKQFSTGTTYFDFNSTMGTYDYLRLVADNTSAGTMLQGGRFQMNRVDSNKLPALGQTATLVNAEGGFLSSADGVNASAISISDFSPLILWDLKQQGNNLMAQYQGLNPYPLGYSFNKNQQNFLNYVISGYYSGDRGVDYALGSLISNGAAAKLGEALSTLNGAAQTIQPQTIVMTGNTMLGNALSCPTFEKNGTGYGETECVWGKYNGGQMRQASSAMNTGYTVNDNTFSIGAQFRAGTNSFWGTAVRFGFNNSTSTNFAANSNVWDLSVGYKKIIGDYMIGLSAAAGVVSQKNNRYTTDYFTGQNYKMTSESNSYYGGFRARNAYQFNLQNNVYVRPYLDLDLLWIHSPSYQESGNAHGVPLQFGPQNSFNLIASPMVELGAKFNFGPNNDGWVRPFISAGAMLITNNTTNLTASIVGANSGTYQLSSKAPNTLFSANAGIQIFSGKNLDAKLEYSIQAGQGFVGQSGTAKISYRF